MDDEGFDEHHSTTVPAKVFMTWSEDQRSELALQLLLSVSSHSLASVTNRLAPLLQKDFVSLLPVELSIHILSYTDARTLGRAARVCRKWRALASENSSWKSSYFRNGWTVNENYLDKLLFQLGFHTSKVPCTSQSHSSSISSLSLQIAASSPAASSSVYPCNTCISENNDLQTVDTCLQFFQNNSDPLASSSLRSTASKLSLPISGLSLPLSQWNPLDSRWSATHQDLTFSTSIGLLNSIDDNCGGSEANNHYTPTTLLSSQNLDTSQAYQASSRHGNNMAPVNCFGSSWKGKQALFTGSTSSLTNDPPASSTGLSMLSTSYAIPVSPNHHPLSSRTHRSDFTNFEDESLSLGDINSPTPHTLGVSLGSNMFGSPNPNTLSSSINAIESKLSNFSMQLPQHNLTNLMGTSSLYSANITSLDRYKHLDWKHIYHQRFLLSRNWRDGIYTARNINAHDEAIYCLQFDEDKIISGSRDGITLVLHDASLNINLLTLILCASNFIRYDQGVGYEERCLCQYSCWAHGFSSLSAVQSQYSYIGLFRLDHYCMGSQVLQNYSQTSWSHGICFKSAVQ
ncbi:hypothetical protein, variant [Batrachochytrium dendrobatidis JEL423]|uniref:F-box domain-containing protein n=1 Tax=Batrachochytrium dendrobatidis (strain JEL423) TaxID=403673 RepID=A0A177WM38_BATDL|nr:hypothetical protein, variant [Batrachochytrium dendrobatidis JEL423]